MCRALERKSFPKNICDHVPLNLIGGPDQSRPSSDHLALWGVRLRLVISPGKRLGAKVFGMVTSLRLV